MDDQQTRTRVAVIGSGLAGLTAAHLLSIAPATCSNGSSLDIEVHLFEKSEQLGMDNSSISIKGEKGSYRVDVPMRSINGGSHGRVKKLYDYLRVPLEKNEFSYSFSRLDHSTPVLDDSSASSSPSTSSTAFDSRASTPLPPYSKESTISDVTQRSRTTSKSPNRSSISPSHSSSTTTRTTTLLYEGSSGLKWPPVSLPSSLATSTVSLPALLRSTWSQAHYIVHLLFLAISYLHLLLLSFFYVSTGLTQNRQTLRLPLLKLNNVGKEPLEVWCDRHGVFRAMKEEVLIPLMAAVCTVGIEEARTMPVGEALEYITSTFLSAHYTTAPSFGVRGIVRRLISPVPVSNIHLSAHIQRINYNSSESGRRLYTLCYHIGEGEGKEQEEGEEVKEVRELDVDYLVFATQANQAASLLSTLSASSTLPETTGLGKTLEALRSFEYVSALVVNHTDRSFLPAASSDLRDLNLAAYKTTLKTKLEKRLEEEEDRGIWTTHLPPTSIETTHIVSSQPSLLSHRSSSAPSTILQTTNPLRPVREADILSSSWFSRAFVSARSKDVLPSFLLGERTNTRPSLQGLALGGEGDGSLERNRGGCFFVGSWCGRGIPLLEGCVTSAEEVTKSLVLREGGKLKRGSWPF